MRRTGRAPALVAFVCVLALSAGAFGATGRSEKPKSKWLDAEQRRKADALVSIFENSTPKIQYSYAENLDDGRGITSGRAGFTTATCDAFEVIKSYIADGRPHAFEGFVGELKRLCTEHSDDTSGLPEDAYIGAWKAAASDKRFRNAQDRTVDTQYYEPAMRAADQLGLRTALARAQLYDAAVQHGLGDDPDGLPALITRTTRQVGSPADSSEKAWLAVFFDVRIADLKTPTNEATAAAWRDSVDRVNCMQSLAAARRFSLRGSLTCSVFGTTYTLP
jgi:chitosanase